MFEKQVSMGICEPNRRMMTDFHNPNAPRTCPFVLLHTPVTPVNMTAEQAYMTFEIYIYIYIFLLKRKMTTGCLLCENDKRSGLPFNGEILRNLPKGTRTTV